MATKAKSGFGTKFQFKASAGGVPPAVPVGELTNISPPKLKADTIEVTSHDSPDAHREYIAGLRDGGEVAIEGNSIKDDPGQVRLLSTFQAGTADIYEIIFTDASKWEFTAVITSVETGAPHDGKISFSAGLKVSGKPVFTAGA
jgi:predicted secreted protein